ncbi:MAG TPA: HipA family kinase [Verrucomicrobiae bacterium]|jgi:hypothetical protein|nr:HipA family kinase [Verrucomicrobiae bacterium]
MRSFSNNIPEIVKIRAIKHIRRMGGASKGHMCECSDGYNYIVKFQNNPEGNRTLANDLLGTLLARYLGLPVADPAIVEVTEDLTPAKRDRVLRYDPGCKLGPPGKCFGSKYLTPRMASSHRPNSVVPGDLNRAYLSKLRNLEDFAGMLVFDKWACNTDPRQVVFVRNEDNRDSVVMIDFGYCFHGPNWRFPPYTSIGVFGEWYVYNAIEGMEAFEPWLQILENDLGEDVIASLASLIPPIWYDFDVVALRLLLTSLNERRKLVREMLQHSCSINCHSFRNWMTPTGIDYFVASA